MRRAYLRAVKKHKPERDPEGFKRVREAYEVAGSQIVWRRHVEDDSDSVPDSESAPDSDSVPDSDPELWAQLEGYFEEVGALGEEP
ncbi:hypothetical protein JYT22_01345, partial [Endomicrobium sp. AH-315-J14]|nr:hypothetical protein [Endomicrobium sp. AH-315-J14]